MGIKNLFNKNLKKGFMFKFRIGGKMFDPRDQERTSAMSDLLKQKKDKIKKMLDKMFKSPKQEEK